MRITRTLAVTLAVSLAAFVAPAAQARPHAPAAEAQPPDMHASVALAAAASRQDLRGPDALDAAMCPRNNTLTAGASSQRPTPASSTGFDRTPNGLGVVAGLLVLGGFAALYGRGHRSRRLRAGH